MSEPTRLDEADDDLAWVAGPPHITVQPRPAPALAGLLLAGVTLGLATAAAVLLARAVGRLLAADELFAAGAVGFLALAVPTVIAVVGLGVTSAVVRRMRTRPPGRRR